MSAQPGVWSNRSESRIGDPENTFCFCFVRSFCSLGSGANVDGVTPPTPVMHQAQVRIPDNFERVCTTLAARGLILGAGCSGLDSYCSKTSPPLVAGPNTPAIEGALNKIAPQGAARGTLSASTGEF